jgi:integrase/recombinase XerD
MYSRDDQEGSLYTQTGERKYLTPEERRAFIAAARCTSRPEVGSFCLTLAFTGCRISEALALTGASVITDRGCLVVRSLKKRRAGVFRDVPVPDDLVNLLLSVHQPDCKKHSRLWTLSRGRYWHLVKEVMSIAGIPPGPHASPKGLRHAFGLHAIRSGIPLNLVQRWLGHASMTTTAIYLQALGDEEREIASRMWAGN